MLLSFVHAMKKKTLLSLIVCCLPIVLLAQEQVDLAVVNRIKAEAFQNSKVMDHAFSLTDLYGPRLADSPGYLKAAEWAVKSLKGWGLEDAKLEKWGAFGRSWSASRFAVHMLEPQQTSLIGVPLAWSPGTDGAVTGEVVMAPIRTVEDFEKYKGKLKGKFVMLESPRELTLHLEPDAKRLTDADLAQTALAPEPAQPPFGPRRPGGPGGPAGPRNMEEARQFRNKLSQFLKEEGVLAIVSAGYSGDDGTIFAAAAGSREVNDPVPPTSIALASEHYSRIARLIEKSIPVRLELEVKAQFHGDSVDGVNVIANLPGGKKKDEIVMIGAHLDSWQAGTGATDNGAGCAVMMEVVRILAALNLKMDRTVRIGLWDAEEEGLVGSREYVKEHFADRETMALKPEHSKLSGYFNFDNGSGKIRGVYLQGNDMMRPIFEAWLAPFKDLGASTITIRNTGGTDHQSFDAVGLPGFQFIQDPLDYMSRTHHTNMDTYDRLQKGDLMQASAIIASLVYDAATRPEMLPRKPLPKPQPRREEKKEERKKN
jgi:carboxypeptidase Q